MFAKTRLAILMLSAAALTACSSAPPGGVSSIGPDPEQMRTALVAMLHERPDIAIPEFEAAKAPVDERDGLVFIGAWNCNPRLMTFEAVFTAPNITLYEVSGRFQTDARGIWRALPRHVQLTQVKDAGPIWRASDVNPY